MTNNFKKITIASSLVLVVVLFFSFFILFILIYPNFYKAAVSESVATSVSPAPSLTETPTCKPCPNEDSLMIDPDTKQPACCEGEVCIDPLTKIQTCVVASIPCSLFFDYSIVSPPYNTNDCPKDNRGNSQIITEWSGADVCCDEGKSKMHIFKHNEDKICCENDETDYLTTTFRPVLGFGMGGIKKKEVLPQCCPQDGNRNSKVCGTDLNNQACCSPSQYCKDGKCISKPNF